MTDGEIPPYEPRVDPYEDLVDLTGEEPLPQLEDPTIPPATPPRSPLLTGLIIGLLLVALSVALFQLLRDDETTAATTTTTAAPSNNGTVTTTTGSTDPGSTGTTLSNTTLVASFEPFAAVGEAVAIEDLQLSADSLGPIELGTAADQAIGRLVSSLGDPDEDSGPVTSFGAYGACSGDIERIVRWGPLVAVVTEADDANSIFAGYRLDVTYGGVSSSTATLATLSGLRMADSVARLDDIYGDSFDIAFVATPALGDTFELRSQSSGDLLIWGPITSAETDGIVLGIYSPDACGCF